MAVCRCLTQVSSVCRRHHYHRCTSGAQSIVGLLCLSKLLTVFGVCSPQQQPLYGQLLLWDMLGVARMPMVTAHCQIKVRLLFKRALQKPSTLLHIVPLVALLNLTRLCCVQTSLLSSFTWMMHKVACGAAAAYVGLGDTTPSTLSSNTAVAGCYVTSSGLLKFNTLSTSTADVVASSTLLYVSEAQNSIRVCGLGW